jgi:UDP-N-acetylglucosamine 2-epimerase
MGEEPSRVFNVGEPGIENCLNTAFLSKSELADFTGFSGINGDYCVVTFHPVTMEDNSFSTKDLSVQVINIWAEFIPERRLTLLPSSNSEKTSSRSRIGEEFVFSLMISS